MRRDVYIENDSGGFSVLAADAVDAIIEDQRTDDSRFVNERKAMLIGLYGDDSMTVRVVVDEPLSHDEEAQWLARYTWEIDTADGNMLVMGGFDPDVLSWWKEVGAVEADGRGVGSVTATPGKWRVDVYAHAGSMNGRVILGEASEKPGSAFRRSHPGRTFPLWLAKMLEFSGEDDPGFEEHWRDVKGSMEAGKLAIDTESGDAIGFLVHFTRSTASVTDPPEVWFDHSHNSRVPDQFPLGLVSEVPDPNLRGFYDRILGIEHPEPPRPVATTIIEIIEAWTGDPLKAIDGGPVSLPIADIYLLYWMAALCSDSSPRFEIWAEPKGAWTPPEPTADNAVTAKNAKVTAIGPVQNTGGWHTWWAARDAVKALTGIPDDSTIDLAMARNKQQEQGDEHDPAIGRALYSGKVSGGKWQISEVSPKVSARTLEEAIAFTRDMANNRIQVRNADERRMFDEAAAKNFVKPETIRWDGNVPSLTDRPDDREFILIAQPLFRARFGSTWPVDVEEPDEDDDDV